MRTPQTAEVSKRSRAPATAHDASRGSTAAGRQSIDLRGLTACCAHVGGPRETHSGAPDASGSRTTTTNTDDDGHFRSGSIAARWIVGRSNDRRLECDQSSSAMFDELISNNIQTDESWNNVRQLACNKRNSTAVPCASPASFPRIVSDLRLPFTLPFFQFQSRATAHKANSPRGS